MREAKRRARKFDFGGVQVVVFCGSRVASAFAHGSPHFSYENKFPLVRTSIPHPSGVSRWWNDPVNELRAARFLREAWAEYASKWTEWSGVDDEADGEAARIHARRQRCFVGCIFCGI